MSTMNISLPEPMKAFVDSQVTERGYGTSSEYVRELIRKEQDLQHLRAVLLAGGESAATHPVDADYFDSLRARIARKTSPAATKQPAVRRKPASKTARSG